MGLQSFPRPSFRVRVLLCTALLLLSGAAAVAQTIHATAVPLILPTAIAYDSVGNLYVAEMGKHVVRKIDPQGILSTCAGNGTQGFSGDGGSAAQAQLDSPQGLAMQASTLYIADTHNHRVRAVDLATGTITTIAGTGLAGFSGDGGLAVGARLNLPTALAVDAAGNLYLADTANHRVRRIAATSGMIATVAGSGRQGDTGDGGLALAAALDSPAGLALDAAGNLYLTDTHNKRVRKVTAGTGAISTIAGDGKAGSSLAELAFPMGITLDAAGNLYVADSENHRILRRDGSTGTLSVVAGNGVQGFGGDGGAAVAAMLDSPRWVGLDSAGQITLSDTHNQRLRQIATDASIATIAGLGSSAAESLRLTAPAVIAYGTGSLTAVLSGSGAAAGQVTLFDTFRGATTAVGTSGLTAGAASFSLLLLSAGVHSLTASYGGDATHAAAQSLAMSVTVTPAPTATALTLSSATTQPMTVSVAVLSTTSGTPTGAVTLLNGGAAVAHASLSGTATASTSLSGTATASAVLPVLASGSYILTAAYGGDANFQGSSSAPATVTVVAPSAPGADFTLAANAPLAQRIAAGTTATYSFTTQTQGPLASAITLSVAGLPAGATGTFNPTYLPPGMASNNFTLTITTMQPAIRTAVALWLTLPTLLGIGWGCRRRNGVLSLTRLPVLWPVILLCGVLLPLTACGDRISTANQQTVAQAATYTVAVTATATDPGGALLVHQVTVTLTVQ